MTTLDKDALIAQFKAYLDESDTIIPSEATVIDLFSLFKELIALKNEVKLESRQIKSALENFKSVFSTLQSSHDLLSQEITAKNQNQHDQQRQLLKPLLCELLSFRDYFKESMQNFTKLSGGKRGWFAWRNLRSRWACVNEGNRMLLNRLDALLKAQGVVPMAVVGKPLDPQCARAVQVDRDDTMANGIVLSELRQGFYWQQHILRVAEVVVNKRGEIS